MFSIIPLYVYKELSTHHTLYVKPFFDISFGAPSKYAIIIEKIIFLY